jgi:chromate reductase, NAD(P)H dehydrogenase (quinone)
MSTTIGRGPLWGTKQQMNANTIPSKRLLGLTGSLRKDSYSTSVLRSLQSALSERAVLGVQLPDLPLYNEDQDGPGGPYEVRAFRRSIAKSDALIISTPEYNHGIPGVLKNALDWASRPYGKSVLTGKPVLVISTSPAFTGGVRAHAQANETLLSAHAVLVPGPQVVIGGIAERITEGRLTDEASLAFSLTAVDRLLALCNRFDQAG